MKGIKSCSAIAAMTFAAAFAAPISAQVLSPATGPIAVDGDPAKWGAVALPDRSGGVFTAGTVGNQYVWKDQLGDAAGNGLYVEPTNPNITMLQLDIDEFRFAYDLNNLYFYTRLHGDQQFFDSGVVGARVGI